jgi:hypothetical protein
VPDCRASIKTNAGNVIRVQGHTTACTVGVG